MLRNQEDTMANRPTRLHHENVTIKNFPKSAGPLIADALEPKPTETQTTTFSANLVALHEKLMAIDAQLQNVAKEIGHVNIVTQ
jgi:ABC-type Zn uptake system ZnuABC Zn-binding protein ZnuA